MRPEEIEKTVEEIFALYEKYGTADYIGESISQIEHQCQAAQLAERGGFDEEVILAAFFHDIGHLAEHVTDANNMGGYGIKEHEKLGADFLRARGFTEKIAALVESHVAAKRYLTFADENYYNQLSEASKKTLEYQGGRMTAEEAETFRNSDWFELKIQLRRWDEEAKLENVPLPDLEKYKAMAIEVLTHKNK
ncbi:MAG: HDIG domain-containing protein [Chitinophagales bacterium]|nr:HDIG domain-containing protein [Chitinophagales bacterium]